LPTPLGPLKIEMVPRSMPPHLGDEALFVRAGDEARIDLHPAAGETQRVPPPGEARAAQLRDRDRPPQAAVVRRRVQLQDAVAHEAQVVVGAVDRRLRAHHHGRAVLDQVAQEGERLPAELDPVRGEIAQGGDRVDEDAHRLALLDRLDDPPRGRIALDLSDGEDVVALPLREELGGGGQVEDGQPGEVQPLRPGVGPELGLVGLQRDEQRALPALQPRAEEVEAERGLAGARPPAQQVGASRDEPTLEHLVEPG
jgi:hypothetical protein